MRHLRNPKASKRGVSNVIVVMLSLVLLVVIVANVILWNYQMNEVDWKRLQERIQITEVSYNPAGHVKISIKNTGSILASIVAVWISKSTLHQRLEAGIHVDTGQTVTYTAAVSVSRDETITIRVTTERGNVASYTATFTYSNGALIVYGEGTLSIPRYREWSSTTYGVEEDAMAASANVYWVVLAASPTRNEKILGTLSSTGYVDVAVWNGDLKTWGNKMRLANVGATLATYRPFDVTYESQSGRAVVVYNPSATGTDPQEVIWNGTWSSPQSIDIGTTGVIYWIRLTSNPKNDELAMMTLDTNQDVYGIVSDGANWHDGILLEDSASATAYECMAVEYTQMSPKAMFTWGSGSSMYSRTWNDSQWSGELAGVNIGATCTWFTLKSDPYSDRLILASVDSASNLNTVRWNETAWILDAEHDNSLETSATMCADVEFETAASHEGHAILVWGDSNIDQVTYRHFNGTMWGAITRIPLSDFPTTDQRWHILRRDKRDGIMLACIDDGSDLNTGYWDGTSWTWTGEIETGVPTVGRQCCDLLPDKHYEVNG